MRISESLTFLNKKSSPPINTVHARCSLAHRKHTRKIIRPFPNNSNCCCVICHTRFFTPTVPKKSAAGLISQMPSDKTNIFKLRRIVVATEKKLSMSHMASAKRMSSSDCVNALLGSIHSSAIALIAFMGEWALVTKRGRQTHHSQARRAVLCCELYINNDWYMRAWKLE